MVLYGSAQADGPFSAHVQVYDENGDPLPRINLRLEVRTSQECPCPFGEGEEPPPGGSQQYFGSDTGTSDSNGYVFLSVPFLPGDLTLMRVYRLSVQYTTLSSENTSTTTTNTLFPVFHLGPPIVDNDFDLVDDGLELQLAEKFKPVFHKHSYDLQNNLESFDRLLEEGALTLIVYNDIGQTLHTEQISGGPEALHKWSNWAWDTYGKGSSSQGVYNLDLDNSYRYEGAPVGQRPVYYHVYKDAVYYYVQYWNYYGANDIREQAGIFTTNWHESDWEHVAIRVTQDSNGNFVPDKVDFQIHNGGKTFDAADCWWSPTNAPTYLGLQQGYDESNTHLHVWIGANSHSSNNRYEKVYKVSPPFFQTIKIELIMSFGDLIFISNTIS